MLIAFVIALIVAAFKSTCTDVTKSQLELQKLKAFFEYLKRCAVSLRNKPDIALDNLYRVQGFKNKNFKK